MIFPTMRPHSAAHQDTRIIGVKLIAADRGNPENTGNVKEERRRDHHWRINFVPCQKSFSADPIPKLMRDDRFILSVTPTKLADYLSCPHKYKLRHVEKIGGSESSPALAFGSSLHLALQHLHKDGSIPEVRTSSAELLEAFWNKSAYATRDENELYFNRGCRALNDYCAAFAGAKEEIIGTEIFMSFIIRHGDLKLRLGCKADRISLDAKGELEVLDYKTNSSGKVPTAEFLQNDLPTFIYYVLARITFPQYARVRVTLLNVLTMGKVSIRYSPEQITKNKHALWQHLKNLSYTTLSPCVSEACSWCQFQDDCPAFNKVVDFADIS